MHVDLCPRLYHLQRLAFHSDNLLDFVSTFGKEGVTQTTGLSQRDKSNWNLTEGSLVEQKKKRKLYCDSQKICVSSMTKQLACVFLLISMPHPYASEQVLQVSIF